MRFLWLAFFAILACAAACGGTQRGVEGTDAPMDATSSDTAASDAAGLDEGLCDGADLPPYASEPGALGCGMTSDGGLVPLFPLFAKCCAVDADCAFGIYQFSCCGDTFALGYNRAETAAFQPPWPTGTAGAAGAPAAACSPRTSSIRRPTRPPSLARAAGA